MVIRQSWRASWLPDSAYRLITVYKLILLKRRLWSLLRIVLALPLAEHLLVLTVSLALSLALSLVE
jgi:hypothetical protein